MLGHMPSPPPTESDVTRTNEIRPMHGDAPDRLLRGLSADGSIAAKVILADSLVAEALSLRAHAPTAGNALGRSLMGALLIAASTGDDDANRPESVQLQLRGNGPLGALTAIADSAGRARGTVRHPEVDLTLADGTPDVARAVGLGALHVVRHKEGWKAPYTGSVPLVSGEIASDLTLYLLESEQKPSAVGLGVRFSSGMREVGAAGFLVEALPGAPDEALRQVEANVAAMGGLAERLEERIDGHLLMDALLDGLGSGARHESEPVFFCPCTRTRALRGVMLLERSELREIVEAQGTQEVCCEFCGRSYEITGDEIRGLLEPS